MPFLTGKGESFAITRSIKDCETIPNARATAAHFLIRTANRPIQTSGSTFLSADDFPAQGLTEMPSTYRRVFSL